jgi:hypothetical protein
VEKIAFLSGVDLTERMEFISPDDGNPDDRTVFRLPLPDPVLPGDSTVLAISFTAKLPEPPFARSGAKEEYVFAGQWFPKVGVYTSAGWNCHQYHAYSEFFADFGVYDVAITVPEDYIVGATGLELAIEHNGDETATHRCRAEDVHDFAWTASPEFVEVMGRAGDVDVRILLQPDHEGQGGRFLEAAKVVVERLQEWYCDYPYPNLTIVDPRRGAEGSGGMEYPTLITVFTSYGLPENTRFLEQVIAHEFAHNYFYHLLASNEFEEPWLDEGLTAFTESEVMRDAYGPAGDLVDFPGLRVSDFEALRASYVSTPDLDRVLRPAWEFYSMRAWVVSCFAKPVVMLATLRDYLGEETLRRIFSSYCERWRFLHPTTSDFVAIANEVSGEDLDWFFDQALFSNAVLDYSVDDVRTEEIEEGKGYGFAADSAATDTSSADVGPPAFEEEAGDTVRHMPDSAAQTTEGGADTTAIYRSVVKVRRLGEFVFPVELEVVFADGERIRETWDGKDLWKKYEYVRPARLASATVDPEGKIPLDVDMTNNSRTVEARMSGVAKLSARILFWSQVLFDQPEMLALATLLSPP